jgi:hypothetical protein
MSNELAVLDLNLPTYLKDLAVDDTTKALMGGSGIGLKRISVRGSVWRMMVNGKEVAKNEERAMQVVIVAAGPKISRSYYAKQWSEGDEPTAPDCWSADGEFADAKAANPQSKRCMDCPQNMKGSGQGDSRACRYSQRLAVVLANDLNGDIFQLVLSAQSIFGEGSPGKWPLQMYAKMIGSKGIPVTAVVTEMRFDTDSSTPKITFKPLRILEAHEHQSVIKQGESEAAKKAITMTVAEVDSAKAPKAAHKAEPTETVVEVKEPVKRVAKKNEEPAAKSDMSKILAEWDD